MRRTYAALLCLLWLLGLEVLPNVHLLSHAHGHTHEHAADGTVITVSFESTTHSHDDGVTHSHDDGHAAKPAKKKKPRDILAIDRVPDMHAAGGIAHRAVALHDAPPPVLDAIADRVVTELVAIATGRATIAFASTADARGPPIA